MKTLKLCLATLLFAASAWATDVYITLDAPTLTASPGDLLSFNGTITSEHMVTIDLNDIKRQSGRNVARRRDVLSVGASHGRPPWNHGRLYALHRSGQRPLHRSSRAGQWDDHDSGRIGIGERL
jgi:hypothetical protein